MWSRPRCGLERGWPPRLLMLLRQGMGPAEDPRVRPGLANGALTTAASLALAPSPVPGAEPSRSITLTA